MKSARLIFLSVVISLFLLHSSLRVPAQQTGNEDSNVTLYSVIKHRGEQLKSCINFKVSGAGPSRAPCDLRYGALYAGNEFDWFESSTAAGNRSVIKDLGARDWFTWFAVPTVEPLPKLKPGEQRRVTVDTSGADGTDGAPSAPGVNSPRDDRRPSYSVRSAAEEGEASFHSADIAERARPSRPKRDGKPKIDPLFVKAIAGHVYVIHVVDDARDFYALFRVDALERGDYCTVSWKLIPAPGNESGASANQ